MGLLFETQDADQVTYTVLCAQIDVREDGEVAAELDLIGEVSGV